MIQQLQLFSDGNVTFLPMPKAAPTSDWLWMEWHADWWEATAPKLAWQPISLYRPYLDVGLAVASPVLLRDDARWLYSSWVKDGWRQYTDGGSVPIDDFTPTHFTEPSAADFIMLAQG